MLARLHDQRGGLLGGDRRGAEFGEALLHSLVRHRRLQRRLQRASQLQPAKQLRGQRAPEAFARLGRHDAALWEETRQSVILGMADALELEPLVE